MNKFFIRFIIACLLLIPAQAVVFNHLILFNVAVPLVFVYLIICMPITMGTNLSTCLGFLIGLGVDIFCDTAGLNAIACTTLAFARKPIFHLYMSMDEDLAGRSPSFKTMGLAAYMKFLLTMLLIYSVIIFTIEAFMFINIKLMLMRIIASTLYSFILLYALDSILNRKISDA